MEVKPKMSKRVDGMRISTYISPECKELLTRKCQEENLGVTQCLEKIIKQNIPPLPSQERTDLERVLTLTEINQHLYIATNATYSNINQIAYALNVALKLNRNAVLTSETIIGGLTEELKSLNENIAKFRPLILQFLLILNSGNPQQQRKIQKIINRVKKKNSREFFL